MRERRTVDSGPPGLAVVLRAFASHVGEPVAVVGPGFRFRRDPVPARSAAAVRRSLSPATRPGAGTSSSPARGDALRGSVESPRRDGRPSRVVSPARSARVPTPSRCRAGANVRPLPRATAQSGWRSRCPPSRATRRDRPGASLLIFAASPMISTKRCGSSLGRFTRGPVGPSAAAAPVQLRPGARSCRVRRSRRCSEC